MSEPATPAIDYRFLVLVATPADEPILGAQLRLKLLNTTTAWVTTVEDRLLTTAGSGLASCQSPIASKPNRYSLEISKAGYGTVIIHGDILWEQREDGSWAGRVCFLNVYLPEYSC